MAGQGFQKILANVRYSFAITVFVTVDTLFMHVTADDQSSTHQSDTEVKYAVIGTAIGIFLTACFIAIKLYMIKRHMLDNDPSEDSVRR